MALGGWRRGGSVNPARKWRTIAWAFLLMIRPDEGRMQVTEITRYLHSDLFVPSPGGQIFFRSSR